MEAEMIAGTTLFVITSYSHKSLWGVHAGGFSFPELAIPYYILQDSGVAAELCTIKGGAPHPEAASFHKEDRDKNPYAVNRFLNDIEAMYKLENSLPIESYAMKEYDALYVVGGQGAAHDIRHNNCLRKLVQEACLRSLPIAAIGESASVLLGMKPEDVPDLEECSSFILGAGAISSREIGERIRDSILATKNLSDIAGGADAANGAGDGRGNILPV
jgi:putative intracellular protease/amidase